MVKKGYKQTELGVIPEKWTVSTIGAIADVKTGPFGSALHANDYVQDGTPIITVEHLGETGLTRQNLPKVSAEDRRRLSAYSMQEGDIVFSRVGSVDRNAYVTAAENGWLFSGRILRLRAKSEELSTRYLGYYFKAEETKERVRGVAVGQTMASLNTKLMNAFKVVLPTVEEQKNIAALLSNMDTLISALEKQISKKKAIKQGTMQELLTGKRRLPGFSGEWRYFNLMKNSKVKARIGWQGLKKSEYLDSGYALLVTGTDFDDGRVLWDGCHYVTRSRYEQDRNIQLQNNDILITKDGSLGKAALVQGLTKPATLNSGIFVIRPLQDAYDPVFVYQILSSFVFKNFLDRLSAGSTIIHLYQKDVGKFEFLLPPTIAEQKAIAEALSEMDADIAALENKLTKYRQVKQGMMQQLLTGKIRLKNDVEDLRQAEQANAVKTLPARTAHNRQFDDAVSIAAIVDAFYSDKYPLGRVKVQKLLYLLHRHQAVSVSDFKKKAAGPYADTVRYKGGEPIAKKNKYIVSENGKQGTRYSRGENMAQALNYVERWGMQSDLQWLKDNFLHTGRNDLELFATVDMAICDLNEAGVPISVASIKDLIASSKEWKAKLSKTYFSDRDIARAIKKCTELFN